MRWFAWSPSGVSLAGTLALGGAVCLLQVACNATQTVGTFTFALDGGAPPVDSGVPDERDGGVDKPPPFNIPGKACHERRPGDSCRPCEHNCSDSSHSFCSNDGRCVGADPANSGSTSQNSSSGNTNGSSSSGSTSGSGSSSN